MLTPHLHNAKLCSSCKNPKDISDFSKMGRRVRSQCKACCNATARAYSVANNRTIKRRFSLGKGGAKRRGLEWTVTLEEYTSKIKHGACFYCDGKISETGHGLDRINNTEGYTFRNTVPCCPSCNRVKCELLTYEDMIHLGDRVRSRGGWIL